MKYDSPKLASIILSLLAFFAVICPSAQAAYSVTFAEVGTDVVATGSGSLNLGDLTLGIPGNDLSYVFASFPALVVGPASPTGFERYSGTFAGPANFGSGGQFFADTGTGPLVGVATLGTAGVLAVPTGYISGTLLGLSTDTWNNATFASLGITAGTYVWNWGSGANADTFTLRIGPTNGTGNGVPEGGSAFALMLAAGAILATVRHLPSREATARFVHWQRS